MYLKELQLQNFKNHTQIHFSFNEKVICFIGDNGAGKTNILDAIHYLSQTKSYFNHIDLHNIKFNENYFMLKGLFVKGENNIEIQCNIVEGKGKLMKNNNKKYQRFSEHIGKFPVVIISPTDTNLILEGSDVRRKYIDSSIAQYKQSYLQILIQYNRVLKQRNSLLKQYYDNHQIDSVVLEMYNQQIIDLGVSIHEERTAFIKELTPIFDQYYHSISSGKESVSLVYDSQLLNNSFPDLLEKSYKKDLFSGYTQCGIHKDDVLFNINEYPIKKMGSQGQQKSFLIALKLAQFDFLSAKIGFKPVLLLDDIFDKLDHNRVLELVRLVDNNVFGQVFITDTHKKRCVEILNTANISHAIFMIDNGSIV